MRKGRSLQLIIPVLATAAYFCGSLTMKNSYLKKTMRTMGCLMSCAAIIGIIRLIKKETPDRSEDNI